MSNFSSSLFRELSEAELKAFTDDIKAKGVFATDRRETDVPSYDEWTDKYTDEWFSKNGLVIINVEADSKVMPKIIRLNLNPSKSPAVIVRKFIKNTFQTHRKTKAVRP